MAFERMDQRRWSFVLAGLFFLSCFEFLFFLSRPDVTTPHEGRVAASAREMLAEGDWILPRLNGEPRLEKPPLAYWAAMAFWKLAGGFDIFWARLPAALAGVLSALLVADLGRRVFGKAAGWASGLIWATTIFTVAEHRKAMADPYLAFFTLLAVWSWSVSNPLRDTGLDPGAARPRPLPVLLFWLALALGGLAKGPVMLLHAALALAPYQLALKRWPRWSRWHVAGLALFLAAALPWPLAILAKVPGAFELWISESAGQLTSQRHARPWWYYLPQLPFLALPWTWLAIPGLGWPLREWRRILARLSWPIAWLGLAAAFFSCSAMKKNAYLLPVLPALALILGWFWQELAWTLAPAEKNFWLSKFFARRRFLAPGLLIAAALAAHLKAAWVDPWRKGPESPAPFAREVCRTVGESPLHAASPVDEALLFYLGRRVAVAPQVFSLGMEAPRYVLARERDLQALPATRKCTLLFIDGAHCDSSAERWSLLRLDP